MVCFFYHLNNLFLIIHNNPPCHNYHLHYSICPACGKQNRTLVHFCYYTTYSDSWQLPMIYMNFRYFIHELCNLKENYAFVEKKCEIANFSATTVCMRALLDRMVLMCHMRMDYLHIFLIIIGNYLLRGMYKAKYLIDQQEKYKALKTFLFHLNHSISF